MSVGILFVGQLMSEDANSPQDSNKKSGILKKITGRIFRDNELSGSEAKDVLNILLETGDKAKTEIVKLLAREVRTYLEAMALHEDVKKLLSNYSLEIKANISLKPLNDESSSSEDEL